MCIVAFLILSPMKWQNETMKRQKKQKRWNKTTKKWRNDTMKQCVKCLSTIWWHCFLHDDHRWRSLEHGICKNINSPLWHLFAYDSCCTWLRFFLVVTVSGIALMQSTDLYIKIVSMILLTWEVEWNYFYNDNQKAPKDQGELWSTRLKTWKNWKMACFVYSLLTYSFYWDKLKILWVTFISSPQFLYCLKMGAFK